MSTISLSPGFQNSVNVGYDIYNSEKISSYIPTDIGTQFLRSFFMSLDQNASDRSWMMIGSYGSGKSHLSTVLGALLANEIEKETFDSVLEKINDIDSEFVNEIKRFLDSNKKYLPVILSGNGNGLEQSLLLGLRDALDKHNISDLIPQTVFQEILNHIDLWRTDFEATYAKFIELLQEKFNLDYEDYKQKLLNAEPNAYNMFDELFPLLSAGARFSSFTTNDVAALYTDVAQNIKIYGFDGIVVLFDEFNNLFEVAASNNKKLNLKPLQDLAEAANRSGDHPIHLLLISHLHLAQYAARLSEDLINEWRKVSGRFREYELTLQPSQTYSLMSKVIIKNNDWWIKFKSRNQSKFNSLIIKTRLGSMFQEIPSDDITDYVICGCYPLHPCSAFILPRISNLVAQNERTVFSFLASNDFNALGSFVTKNNMEEFRLLTPDVIYDYFEPLMRKQDRRERIYGVWAKTAQAIEAARSLSDLAVKIVKVLGLFEVVGEPCNLPLAYSLVEFALCADGWVTEEELNDTFTQLVQQKILYVKRSNGIIEILKKDSDVNIDEEIQTIKTKAYFTQKFDLGNVLNEEFRPYPVVARKYNDINEMVRFFVPKYYTWEDIDKGIDWDDELELNGYLDGIIAFLLPDNEDQADKLVSYTRNHINDQVIFIVVKKPVVTKSLVADYKATLLLINDSHFNQEHPLALAELMAYHDDFSETIEIELKRVTSLHPDVVQCFAKGKNIKVSSLKQLNRLVSKTCLSTFDKTPKINNEMINKNNLTATAKNARTKVIAGILNCPLKRNLGFSGAGPEVSIFRSLLKRPGVYKEDENRIWLELDNTNDKHFSLVVKEIEQWIEKCSQQELVMSDIYSILRKHPYGLRLGVIPVLLALCFTRYNQHLIIRDHLGVEKPLTAHLLEQIDKKPNAFRLQLVDWDNTKNVYLSKLEYLFAEYQDNEGINTSNIMYPVARSIINWFTSLPKYTRETKELALAASLCRLLNRPILDSADFLFKRLPYALIGDKEFICEHTDSYITCLLNAKTELDSHCTVVIQKINSLIIKLFAQGKEEEVLSALRNWYENLNGKTRTHLFDGSTQAFIDCIKGYSGWDNHKFLVELSRKMTGLRLEDWSDNVFNDFCADLETAERNVQGYAQEENIDFNNATEVKFSINGVERTFTSSTISGLSETLMNMLDDNIKSFGEAISVNEKRQILVNLLEDLEN